jgi:probable F420-dependent oxidoreductase
VSTREENAQGRSVTVAGIVPPGRVIYGTQLPIQTLTATTRVPWELEAGVDDLVAVAQQAETTGHSFVGVCDHIAIPDNDYAAHMTTTWYDTVATLGFLAAQTHAIRLLSVVWIAAYRHPLQTAKSFATLDHLSGGRVIFGVGAGHVEAEFEALGVDFHSRGRRLDEAIDAVRATFGTDYASFQGRYSSFTRVGIGPQPVHGDLPVWIGGSGPAAWRRVGRRGDGYIPMGNPIEQFPEIMSTIALAAEEAGRGDQSFDIGYMSGIYVGDLPFDPARPTLAGKPDEIAESLRRATAAGANVLHVRFANRSRSELLDQMEAFGRDVAPLVTG